MKKLLLPVVLLIVLAGTGFTEEMLIGISFFLDETGTVYPERGYELTDSGVPFLVLLDFEENREEATVYFEIDGDKGVETVGVESLTEEDYFTAFTLQSKRFGDIKFFIGDEVLADELGAAVSVYQVVTDNHRYSAVGVIASPDFQTTDEQKTMFEEIVEEFTGELGE